MEDNSSAQDFRTAPTTPFTPGPAMPSPARVLAIHGAGQAGYQGGILIDAVHDSKAGHAGGFGGIGPAAMSAIDGVEGGGRPRAGPPCCGLGTLWENGDPTAEMRAPLPVNLQFVGVTYTVRDRSKRGATKMILKDVCGEVAAGELMAIMGTTGSGKSTLLDVLAGWKREGASGLVLVNGKPRRPREFVHLAGYVQQDDTCLGTLTVRENLLFSVELRIPASHGRAEYRRRVEATIAELGLSKCADSLVGDELLRGISGGERKRLAIGLELIKFPSILFLDEPTTGLDATVANVVVRTLKALAAKGRTVLLSIHQPRYSIFREFDRLALVSAGELLYHGAAGDALDYFSRVGYPIEPHNNPADHFLDCANGEYGVPGIAGGGTRVTDSSHLALEVAPNHGLGNHGLGNDHGLESEGAAGLTRANHGLGHGLEEADAPGGAGDYLRRAYKDSAESLSLRRRLGAAAAAAGCGLDGKPLAAVAGETQSQAQPTCCGPPGDQSQWATSFAQQTRVVLRRALLNSFRNPLVVSAQYTVVIIFAGIVGAIYWRPSQDTAGVQNLLGAFFFITMTTVFSNMSGVELFLKARPLYIAEKANGYYRASAYFVATIFVDLVPLRVFPLMVFGVITWVMIGLELSIEKIARYWLALFLLTITSTSVCYCVAAMCGVFFVANLVVAVVYTLFLVFSGLLINLANVAPWLVWLKYLSFIRYAYEIFIINALSGVTLPCVVSGNADISAASPATLSLLAYCPLQGDVLIRSLGMDPGNLWRNVGILIGMSAFYLAVTFVVLANLKKK